MRQRIAVILAAGKGTRMESDLPKVLHEVAGRPMLAYVLDACRRAGTDRIYVVVGHGADEVKTRFAGDADLVWVEQAEQRGTGHAVLCCQSQLADFDGEVLVLCGDGPLIRSETLETLLATHSREQAAVALATVVLDDPAGYGRIVRDEAGQFEAIVEQNDCSPEQLGIHEVNPSYYCFQSQVLFAALQQVTSDNAKNELYLTDAVSIAMGQGGKVVAVTALQADEALSINSPEQLETVERIMAERTVKSTGTA